jgi:uracil-DNA glycosylase
MALIDQLGDWAPVYAKVVAENQEQFNRLTSVVKAARTSTTVYPDSGEVLRAFKLTQLKNVKIVIIGQDPYHNGAATGLAFGVRQGFKINPSLQIIYRELLRSHSLESFENFDYSLEHWARQGVLLLNTTLTVEKGRPNIHQSHWEWFTKAMIKELTVRRSGLIFMLWGKYAKEAFLPIIKEANELEAANHITLLAGHPAAEVYNPGSKLFYGTNCFVKANEILSTDPLATQIDWLGGNNPTL